MKIIYKEGEGEIEEKNPVLLHTYIRYNRKNRQYHILMK